MSSPRPRVIVVDDDVDACRNLNDILSDFGYDVSLAHDGPSALVLAGKQAFDVALLDLRMPGMDGLTVYRELKRIRPETVAVVITAYASEETERQAAREGAWRVLAKPVNVARLLPLIDEACQQPLVLIVDDDTELCLSLWDLLREGGYRVSLAHTGEEAAGRLETADFRVILIDIRLPRESGTEVARRVREARPEARVVLVTGHGAEMESLIREALTLHADAVCYKPFNIPELLTTIGRLATKPAT